MEPDALAAIAREVSTTTPPPTRSTTTPPTPSTGAGFTVEVAADLAEADALARNHGATILVAGSLFLVGEARVRYLGAPADPIVVTDPSPTPTT
jgi:hypothetical protein